MPRPTTTLTTTTALIGMGSSSQALQLQASRLIMMVPSPQLMTSPSLAPSIPTNPTVLEKLLTSEYSKQLPKLFTRHCSSRMTTSLERRRSSSTLAATTSLPLMVGQLGRSSMVKIPMEKSLTRKVWPRNPSTSRASCPPCRNCTGRCAKQSGTALHPKRSLWSSPTKFSPTSSELSTSAASLNPSTPTRYYKTYLFFKKI